MVKNVLVVYESGPNGRAWKGDRVSEVLCILRAELASTHFLGLCGFLDRRVRRSERGWDFLTALPGMVSRFSRVTRISPRHIRNVVSRVTFAAVCRLLNPDVVLTQSTLGAVAAGLKLRGKYVLAECDMTHTLGWRNILEEEGRRIGAEDEIKAELPPIYRQRQEHIAYSAADQVIVFSSWAKDQFPLKLQEKVGVATPLSIRPTPLPAVQADAAEVSFLFVGQLCFRKGAHKVLRAFSMEGVPSSRIDLFGEARPQFRDYIRHNGFSIGENVVFHGHGDWREFVRNIRKRWVAVLPSLVEGSPRFIYEALALGIPSIVSPAAKPDFLTDGKSCLVVEDGKRSLVSAVREIREDPVKWDELQMGCSDAYHAAFAEMSYGRRVLSIIRSSS